MNRGNELSWRGSSPRPKELAEPTRPGLAGQKKQATSMTEIHRRLSNQPPQQPARGGWF
jgi:hypothetical protein